VAARVAGRAHHAKREGRLAREFDHVAVLDEAINANRVAERVGRQPVRRDPHATAEVRAQGLDARDVIGMVVSQDDLAQSPPPRDEIIDARGERGLLVLVGRAGIDDDELAVADEISVRVRRGRLGRRAEREAHKAGRELDAAHLLPVRLRD
jgi:hypothetical protein